MMKYPKRFILFLGLIISSQILYSQSVPTTEWVYNSIRKLQVLGYFQELPPGSKPYSRLAIASELAKIQMGDQTIIPVPQLMDWALLNREFSSEIEQLTLDNPNKTSEYLYLQIAVIGRSGLGILPQKAISARMNYAILPRLSLQYGAIVDQALSADPNYRGYYWRGFSGYQDQLFLLFETPHVKTLFGREYLRWGYAHSGSVFISDNSRPFDMIKFTVLGDMLRFESIVTQLDQMYGSERYLSASRIALKIGSSTTLGLGQSALYGGKDRPLDFTLSNPLSFYSFSQDNDQKSMNGMLYADLLTTVGTAYNIYGELLIDDFQVDRKKKSDLEPNEIAFMIGIEGVQIFDWLDFWLEFTQIRNRTYNVPEIRPWEKFLHRGVPIAHPLGNDFRLLAARGEGRVYRGLLGYLEISIIRKGEGSIVGTFTEPWLSEEVSLEGGYSESIPSGTIETSELINVGLLWRPTHYFYLDTSFGIEEVKNFNNILDQKSRNFQAQFEITAEIGKYLASL
jgi:hypothetical protein